MNADEQLARLTAYVAANPAPRRIRADAELAAEDYWASVGEMQHDEALIEVRDDRWMQERYDNWLERSAS